METTDTHDGRRLPEHLEQAPTPDYSDRPTLIVGYVSNEGEIYGVEAVGFELPSGLRIIARDYAHGPIHEDDLGYEDGEL